LEEREEVLGEAESGVVGSSYEEVLGEAESGVVGSSCEEAKMLCCFCGFELMLVS